MNMPKITLEELNKIMCDKKVGTSQVFECDGNCFRLDQISHIRIVHSCFYDTVNWEDWHKCDLEIYLKNNSNMIRLTIKEVDATELYKSICLAMKEGII